MITLRLTEATDDINKLERIFYEMKARESIFNFLILNNMQNTENYQFMWEEYLCYLKVYEDLKEEFRIKYIIPNAPKNFKGKWELYFNKRGEIIIYD